MPGFDPRSPAVGALLKMRETERERERERASYKKSRQFQKWQRKAPDERLLNGSVSRENKAISPAQRIDT
jgi:hypothetical protein